MHERKRTAFVACAGRGAGQRLLGLQLFVYPHSVAGDHTGDHAGHPLCHFLCADEYPAPPGPANAAAEGERLLPLWGLAVAEPLVFFAESYGILHTNATFAGVMTAIAPLFAIALAALILKEYPSRRQLLFCSLPVLGVIIMVVSGKSLGVVTPIGFLFLLADCVGIGFYRLFNRWASREFTPFERTYMVLLSCLLVFVPSALLSVKGDWGAVVAPLTNPRVIFPVTALCILCSIAANMLVNYAAGRMSVAKLSVFGSLITLCSTFGGIVILREPFSPLSLLGTALIIYGVWQVSRPETDKAT